MSFKTPFTLLKNSSIFLNTTSRKSTQKITRYTHVKCSKNNPKTESTFKEDLPSLILGMGSIAAVLGIFSYWVWHDIDFDINARICDDFKKGPEE